MPVSLPIEIDVLIVSDGNLEPLKRTIASISGVRNGFPGRLRVVVKALPRLPSADVELRRTVTSSVDELRIQQDCGLYDGMNQMLDLVRSEFVIFLNSGDTLAAHNLTEIVRYIEEDAHDVFYTDIIDQARGIVRSRCWPFLLKMPHHQGMVIPSRFFTTTGYRYPDYLRVAGDLDLKMALFVSGYRFRRIDPPLAVCEPAGRSGVFAISNVFARAREMSVIAATRLSVFVAPMFYLLYAGWYLLRVAVATAKACKLVAR